MDEAIVIGEWKPSRCAIPTRRPVKSDAWQSQKGNKHHWRPQYDQLRSEQDPSPRPVEKASKYQEPDHEEMRMTKCSLESDNLAKGPEVVEQQAEEKHAHNRKVQCQARSSKNHQRRGPSPSIKSVQTLEQSTLLPAKAQGQVQECKKEGSCQV